LQSSKIGARFGVTGKRHDKERVTAQTHADLVSRKEKEYSARGRTDARLEKKLLGNKSTGSAAVSSGGGRRD